MNRLFLASLREGRGYADQSTVTVSPESRCTTQTLPSLNSVVLFCLFGFFVLGFFWSFFVFVFVFLLFRAVPAVYESSWKFPG